MQNETATGLHGPTDVNLPFEDIVRDTVLGVARRDAETLEEIWEVDVIGSMIDDETHRPVVRMRAHVDDRAGEPPVSHERHGDE